MEWNPIQWNAVFVCLRFDLDPVRIIRSDRAQRDQMDTNQRKQLQRDGDHVQGEETIERCIADYIIAADPERQVGANPWNRRKEIRDHLRAPVRHLSPRQQIAKKRLGHQAQKNHAAEYPDQFARRANWSGYSAA